MVGKALNFSEMRVLARRRLPRGLFEYIDRGTEDEISLERTIHSWGNVTLTPKALVDVSVRSTQTNLFGKEAALPLVIAPTALAGLVHRDGEIVLARAAKTSGVPFTVATQSVTAIEEIAATGARIWVQLYVWRDRALTHAFIDRAERAGAEALLLTIDTAISPNREYNTHNGFGMPLKPSLRAALDVLARPRWLTSVFLAEILARGVPTYAHYPEEFRTAVGREALGDGIKLCEKVNWNDLAELRRRWKGPLLLKGVLSVADARRALEMGCDGVVVSNHGGRNVDCAPTSVSALPPIVDAVGERMTVLVDSGIRRGSHIARAIALGAKGVLVGRAPLYGLAAGGEAGATRMLSIFQKELADSMALLGCADVAAIEALEAKIL